MLGVTALVSHRGKSFYVGDCVCSMVGTAFSLPILELPLLLIDAFQAMRSSNGSEGTILDSWILELSCSKGKASTHRLLGEL